MVSLDVSDRDLLAIGMGRSVQILRHAFTQPMDVTYLKHTLRTPDRALCAGAGVVASTRALPSSVAVHNVRFRPYEDVLAIGHTHGITSIVVPGSGEPNFDSFESNPFVNKKQRNEQEVQTLLNKLSSETIGIDSSSFIASVDKDDKLYKKDIDDLMYKANSRVVHKKDKHKMRGKGKISAKLRVKQKNVIEAIDKKEKTGKVLAKEAAAEEAARQAGGSSKKKKRSLADADAPRPAAPVAPYDPLARFVVKK